MEDLAAGARTPGPLPGRDAGPRCVHIHLRMAPDLAERCRRVAAQCAATRIHQAARAVSQHYDAVMRASGLARTQFTLLVGSTVAGPEGVPLSTLARLLVLDRTAL